MADATAALRKYAADVNKHDPHSDYYCHVYVNDLALNSMNTGNGTPGGVGL